MNDSCELQLLGPGGQQHPLGPDSEPTRDQAFTLQSVTILTNEYTLYSCFKKGCHSQQSILEPKGALGTVIMGDNTPTKVVTVLLCHKMMNLHSILCKVINNNNKLFLLFEAQSPFRFQYRPLTMTTFFEIAV